MPQQHIDLVRSAYEAYNRRDVEGVMSRFDPDIDWHVPDSLAWGDHVRGLEAIGRFFEGLRPYMGDDHQVAIDELIDAGDRVVALVHIQGRAAVTGLDLSGMGVDGHIWTLRDGRVVAVRMYGGTGDALAEIGR
jgi:ketosteroid isomerase-like protein